MVMEKHILEDNELGLYYCEHCSEGRAIHWVIYEVKTDDKELSWYCHNCAQRAGLIW